MRNVKFYFEDASKVQSFCERHAIPFAAVAIIRERAGVRYEVNVPAEWAADIRTNA
jgi:hypothetical protein